MTIGKKHSVVLKLDGSVWAVGANDNGQLGDTGLGGGKTFAKAFSGAMAVATGHSHTMILDKSGHVWVAGGNEFGQLGDGTKDDKFQFAEVCLGVAMFSHSPDMSVFM